MKQIAILRYQCSFCGAEYDTDEQKKCIEHEKNCEKEYLIHAYELKNMCKRIKENLECNNCPFSNELNCKIGKPSEWNVNNPYD